MVVSRTILCLVALTALVAALPSPHGAVTVDSHMEAMTRDVIQAITAFDFSTASTLYDVIKENGHLDACAFQLASSMKKVMLSTDFEQLSSESKAEFEILKEKLPISVKNAVFAASVCIHNLNFNEYLISPSEEFIYDVVSRNVFLWRNGGNVSGSTWSMESTVSDVDFKLINIYGEYLYADSSHYYLNRRQIFTYIPSQWPGTNVNVWRFQSTGDEVIVSNSWYAGMSTTKEYLYAAANVYNFDTNRRRVFGWDEDWGTDKTHLWRIEEC